MFTQPASWRHLKQHPLGAEYAPLEGEDFERLKAGITEYGVMGGRRITLHQGMVLEGWQMQRACVEVDVRPMYQPLPRDITPEKYVEVMNEYRRHETPEKIMSRVEKRRTRVAEARAGGKSIRAIAEAEEVSPTTVQRDLETPGVPPGTPDANGPLAPAPTKITGADGKQYEPTRPPPQSGDRKRKILCARCQRLDKPSRDCKACQEAANEARAESAKGNKQGKTGGRPAGPKTGDQIVNWQKFYPAYTTVNTAADNMLIALGMVDSKGVPKDTVEYSGLRRLMKEFLEHFIAYYKKLTKQNPPGHLPE